MVTQSVLFGLLTALFAGVLTLGTALAVRRVSTLQVLFWGYLASILVATTYLVTESSLGHLSLSQWGHLVIISIVALASHTANYNALRHGPVAIVAPIDAAHTMIPVLLAVSLLGEQMTGGQAVGATATIGGVVLSSVDFRTVGTGQRLIGMGPLLAIIGMLLFGLAQFLFGRIAQDIGWFLAVYGVRLLTLGLLTSIVVFQRQRPWRGLNPRLLAGVAMIGLLEFGALSAFARGSEIGLISIVAAVTTTYVLVPILGGFLIFRERPARNQTIGMITVLGGLLLLSLG